MIFDGSDLVPDSSLQYVTRPAGAATPLFAAEQRPDFRSRYNRSCFSFDHRLHENPLFDLPCIVELSKRLPHSYWSTSPAAVTSGWETAQHPKLSLPDTLQLMSRSNSLVLLKGLETDPEYGPVYGQLIEQLTDQVGDALRGDVSIGRATLIVSSPGRVTPYHIDAEVNFLLQLRGDKTVNVFDQSDRTLVTDAELEAFYAGDLDAAKYKIDRQVDARVFDFKPGKGVHIPLHAPHWVRNGSSVSVSLSVNFSLRSNSSTADLYRFNHQLRRRGFRPRPPGSSTWDDGIKLALTAGVNRARNLKRKVVHADRS